MNRYRVVFHFTTKVYVGLVMNDRVYRFGSLRVRPPSDLDRADTVSEYCTFSCEILVDDWYRGAFDLAVSWYWLKLLDMLRCRANLLKVTYLPIMAVCQPDSFARYPEIPQWRQKSWRSAPTWQRPKKKRKRAYGLYGLYESYSSKN